MDCTDIKEIINECDNPLYIKKLDSLGKMNQFFERQKLPTHSRISRYLNSPVSNKEIEFVLENLSQMKTPVQDYFIREFYQTFKKEMSSKQSVRKWKIKNFPTHFMKPSINSIQEQSKYITRKL